MAHSTRSLKLGDLHDMDLIRIFSHLGLQETTHTSARTRARTSAQTLVSRSSCPGLIYTLGWMPIEMQPVADTCVLTRAPAARPPCRHRRVPLVCRRFAALCQHPQLLPEEAEMGAGYNDELGRLRSLAEWLVRRAAGTVRVLRLHLSSNFRNAAGPGPAGLGGLPATTVSDQAEIIAETLNAIAACATRGALQELDLTLDGLPPFRLSSATVAALSGLRCLKIEAVGGVVNNGKDGQLAVVGPLHTMTALRELHLTGKGCCACCMLRAQWLPCMQRG